MKRVQYEPPSLVPVGEAIFEPVERQGNEFVVRLTGAFFDLPPELRLWVLGALKAHLRKRDDSCRELVLRAARDGHKIGTFSRQAGLQLT